MWKYACTITLAIIEDSALLFKFYNKFSNLDLAVSALIISPKITISQMSRQLHLVPALCSYEEALELYNLGEIMSFAVSPRSNSMAVFATPLHVRVAFKKRITTLLNLSRVS